MNSKLVKMKPENAERLTSGFTQAGVYSRRQFCADIQVCSPQELLWNPRLREAATTLTASVGQRSGKMREKHEKEKNEKKSNEKTNE